MGRTSHPMGLILLGSTISPSLWSATKSEAQKERYRDSVEQKVLASLVDSVASSETQQRPFAFCDHFCVVGERKLHGACEESMPRAVGCGDVGAPSVSSWRNRTRHGGVCILKLVIIHWNMFILFPIVFAVTLFVFRSTWRRLPHHTPNPLTAIDFPSWT